MSHSSDLLGYYEQFRQALEEYPLSNQELVTKRPEILEFIKMAMDVLENKENISSWVNSKLKALNNDRVIVALYEGRTDEVLDELIRLQDGVYI